VINRDLEQPANLLWFAYSPPSGGISGGETRSFDRLEDAIRFAMTVIPDDVRETAWITVDGSEALLIAEIDAIYRSLPANRPQATSE
jgi:hypothetical protein